MAINFDTLPKEKPTSGNFPIPEPGIYKAKVIKAEMASPKDLSKPDYLQLTLDIDGMYVYDSLFEYDKPALQFKIARFVRACQIPMQGSLDLSDLGKLVVGKEVVVDIINETYVDKTGAERVKAQVDIFTNEVYYTVDEYDELTGTISTLEAPTTDTPTY